MHFCSVPGGHANYAYTEQITPILLTGPKSIQSNE